MSLKYIFLSRFLQELGEGAFGKVYKGELAGHGGASSALVAIKTLKPGANQKTNQVNERQQGKFAVPITHDNCFSI